MTQSDSPRSRIETILLSAQLVLVLVDALSLAQGAIGLDAVAGNFSWVIYLPLACILPSAAAFRKTRAAAIAVFAGATASFLALVWAQAATSGLRAAILLSALALLWPLFLAAGLLFAALRVRVDREREASLLHRHTHSNLSELEASEVCGCIACQRIYSPTDVTRWANGVTALCPHCGADAVVGSASGIPVTPSVLARAHARWFLIG